MLANTRAGQQPVFQFWEESRPEYLRPDSRLDALAELAVRGGLGLVPGQELIVTAPCDALPLVRRVAHHAYSAGAAFVHPLLTDEATILTRYRTAVEGSFEYAPAWLFRGMSEAMANGAARLNVVGGDPALLASENPQNVARANSSASRAAAPVIRTMAALETNWSTIPYATQSWARAVFPADPPERALARLWDVIFTATYCQRAGALDKWRAHILALETRASALNQARYETLHFRGPGTDLQIGLVKGHTWRGGLACSKKDVPCSPNIPSEEVFTTPHRLCANGHVTLTRPLCLQGTIIDGAALTFNDGEVIAAHANSGMDLLQRLLSMDEGARRLGEVALVANSSPIAATGCFFFNTLLDENAGSHIALGQSFPNCIVGGDQADQRELLCRGGNSSAIHIDCVIGSSEMYVLGTTEDGRSKTLMEQGEWVS